MLRTFAVYARFIVEAGDEVEALSMVSGAGYLDLPDMDDAWVEAEYAKLSTGCWIDDRHGVYGSIRLIEIAKEYGFKIYEDDKAAIKAFKDGVEEFDAYGVTHFASSWILDQGGLADMAEDWMNEHVAQEGFSFGWKSGELFYMNNEWWEDES